MSSDATGLIADISGNVNYISIPIKNYNTVILSNSDVLSTSGSITAANLVNTDVSNVCISTNIYNQIENPYVCQVSSSDLPKTTFYTAIDYLNYSQKLMTSNDSLTNAIFLQRIQGGSSGGFGSTFVTGEVWIKRYYDTTNFTRISSSVIAAALSGNGRYLFYISYAYPWGYFYQDQKLYKYDISNNVTSSASMQSLFPAVFNANSANSAVNDLACDTDGTRVLISYTKSPSNNNSDSSNNLSNIVFYSNNGGVSFTASTMPSVSYKDYYSNNFSGYWPKLSMSQDGRKIVVSNFDTPGSLSAYNDTSNNFILYSDDGGQNFNLKFRNPRATGAVISGDGNTVCLLGIASGLGGGWGIYQN
jgi:hypothetical protein